MFAKSATIAILAVAGLVAAAPAPAGTRTERDLASRTVTQTGVTHSVVAGRAGLHFDPENVVAEIGDVIEWHYLPANHSVVQSSFAQPCQPLAGDNGFASNFQPVATGQSSQVFQIVVQDASPLWYYCAQTKGSHCQNGMAGVINQNFNSPNTLSAYKAAAALTGVSIPPSHVSGSIIDNPNPLSGF